MTDFWRKLRPAPRGCTGAGRSRFRRIAIPALRGRRLRGLRPTLRLRCPRQKVSALQTSLAAEVGGAAADTGRLSRRQLRLARRQSLPLGLYGGGLRLHARFVEPFADNIRVGPRPYLFNRHEGAVRFQPDSITGLEGHCFSPPSCLNTQTPTASPPPRQARSSNEGVPTSGIKEFLRVLRRNCPALRRHFWS